MGRLVLMGSGELAPPLVATHRWAIRAAGARRVTVLDTTFGFQENADLLTDRIVEFFRTSLEVEVDVATLRRAADPPAIIEEALALLRRSRLVFAGPGSPSYALGVWQSVGVAGILTELMEAGASVTLASAAAAVAGRKALPVYEIYKVGADPFWLDGLDLPGALGIPAVVVPHWNNAEGQNHDTSRCFVGERRLSMISNQLDTGIIGIDEHTAAVIDIDAETLSVEGVGTVTLRGGSGETSLPSGSRESLDTVAAALGGPPISHLLRTTAAATLGVVEALESGDMRAAVAAALELETRSIDYPESRALLRSAIVELGRVGGSGGSSPTKVVDGFVELLLELRESARAQGRYEEADRIRVQLAERGVEVRDGEAGPTWFLT